jgi:hypothetical protein
VIARLLAPLRRRRAIRALAAYHRTKDEYRRAKVRGDTREQGRLLPLLERAMTERLKAERLLTKGVR